MKVTKQAAIQPGEHTGIITVAHETTKVFDQQKGPEPVVDIVIQPAWKQDAETETLPVNVTFSPVLNGISALSKLLVRLGREPDGDDWTPESLVGCEVRFVAQKTDRDFVRVNKDTLRKK